MFAIFAILAAVLMALIRALMLLDAADINASMNFSFDLNFAEDCE